MIKKTILIFLQTRQFTTVFFEVIWVFFLRIVLFTTGYIRFHFQALSFVLLPFVISISLPDMAVVFAAMLTIHASCKPNVILTV